MRAKAHYENGRLLLHLDLEGVVLQGEALALARELKNGFEDALERHRRLLHEYTDEAPQILTGQTVHPAATRG